MNLEINKNVNTNWSFGKKVPKTFSKHIRNSVPFYDEVIIFVFN